MVITCICPTADRPEFTAQAIRYYQNQTYSKDQRRLLVYDTSANSKASGECLDAIHPVNDSRLWVVTFNDADGVRCTLIEYGSDSVYSCASRMPSDTIGAIRNRAVSLALKLWPQTELIAHMDSDDYYSPTRLSRQSELHLASGKQVSGFSTVKFTDGSLWWRYSGTPIFVFGASLMYTPDWWRRNPFPAIDIGEDNMWSRTALNAKQLSRFEGCQDRVAGYTSDDLMVVRVHDGNSSKKLPRKELEALN